MRIALLLLHILWGYSITVFGSSIRGRQTKKGNNPQQPQHRAILELPLRKEPTLDSKNGLRLNRESFFAVFTPRPTPSPTTAAPSPKPTTGAPSPKPTGEPTFPPTFSPTSNPTPSPSALPSDGPSNYPSTSPTTSSAPSFNPTPVPTPLPSTVPTQQPTCSPLDYDDYFEKGKFSAYSGGQDATYVTKCDEKLDIVALKAIRVGNTLTLASDPASCQPECLGKLPSILHKPMCKEEDTATFILEGDYSGDTVLIGSLDKDLQMTCDSMILVTDAPTDQPSIGPTNQPSVSPTKLPSASPTQSPTCTAVDYSGNFEKKEYVSRTGEVNAKYTVGCDEKLDIVVLSYDPNSCNVECLGSLWSTEHSGICKEEKEVTFLLDGDYSGETILIGNRDMDVTLLCKQLTLASKELTDKGNDGDDVFPLSECEGDCDNDSDCSGSLQCFQRSNTEPVPGCEGRGRSVWDYCFDPSKTKAPSMEPTRTPTEQSFDLVLLGNDGDDVFPLPECAGDCDSDSDCQSNFVCFQRDGLEPVPGCNGSGRSGSDYCIDPAKMPPPTSRPTIYTGYGLGDPNYRLKIRLYWEEGYTWQETTKEAWWCMECAECDDYSTGDGPDVGCEVAGTSSSDCRDGDMVWLRDCRTRSRLFEWNVIKNDKSGDMIRADGTDLCFSTVNDRYLEMKECNPKDSKQLWASVDSLSQFELRPYYQRNWARRDAWCLSQRHHPKDKEMVGLHRCSTAHGDETAYWGEY